MSNAQTTHLSPGDGRSHNLMDRLPHLVVFLAVGVALGGAAAMRLAGGPAPQPTTHQVAVRELRFADQTDGSIAITEAPDGRTITTLAPGSNGFIRATMRVLAQQRLRSAEGPQVPFKLTAWSDGRLTLDDPDTGRRIDLEAFGHTNEAAFARLLTPAGQPLPPEPEPGTP